MLHDAAADHAVTPEDEWIWGWDATPGIVSVWATFDGRAIVWRRVGEDGALVRDQERFRPWVLLDSLDDLQHLGQRLGPESDASVRVAYRELGGDGALRWLVTAADTRTITLALLHGASRRLGRPVAHVRELGAESILLLPPEEQYLVATGRTYFRDLSFDQIRRLQFDLETTGLDPRRDRIFMASVRDPDGRAVVFEAPSVDDAGEAEVIKRLVAAIRAADPDVIENHNLHGFDLPFLDRRARTRRRAAIARPSRAGRASAACGAEGFRRRPE